MVHTRRWRALTMAVAAVLGSAAASHAATISGTVVSDGSDSHPISGATVAMVYLDGTAFASLPAVKTDDKGRFSITFADDSPTALLIKQAGYPVLAFAPGYGIQQVSAKSLDPVQVRLSPELVFHGRIADSQGKPVAGIKIGLTGELLRTGSPAVYASIPPALQDSFVTTTDAQGHWKLGGVSKNPPMDPAANANPQKPHADFQLLDPRFIESTLSVLLDNTKEVDFVARTGGSISGRLVDASGAPRADVTVEATSTVASDNNEYGQNEPGSETASTRADGTFVITGLPRSAYVVTVDADKWDLVAPAVTDVSVVAGKSSALPAPIVLKPGAVIQGVIVSKETGKPVPGLELYTYGPQYPSNPYGQWKMTARSDSDGKYSLRVVAGSSEVHIGSATDGFAYFDPAVSVSVQEGETKVLPPFQLPVARHVTLKVTDDAGKPLADLPVIVLMPDVVGYSLNNAARTDGAGIWDSSNQNWPTLSSDETRPWQIKVPLEWEVVSPKELTLPVESPVTVVVRKSDFASHPRGHTVTPDGTAIGGTSIYVFSYVKDANGLRDYKNEYVNANADGQFLLTPLRPGAVARIGVSQWNYRRGHNPGIDSPITLPSDGTQPDLGNIVLIPLVGSVSGTLVDAANKPVSGAWLWSEDGDQRCVARTDTHGQFTIQHLPLDGPVTVHAAQGLLTTSYTTAKRDKAAVQLPAARHTSDATMVAYDRRRGLALLTELAHEAAPAQGPRDDGDGKDTLADMMASLDVDIAVHVGTPASGIIDEKVVSGILENAVQNDPVKARALFLAHRDGWTNADMIFYRNIDMAMAFANRDPVFANECYHAAAKLIGDSINADSTWELNALTKAAFRLNAPDADDWAKRAIAAMTKSMNNGDDALVNVAESAAEGDGVRAAALITGLPADKRLGTACRILAVMADQQPLEAKKLYDAWIVDGTVNPTNDQSGGQLNQGVILMTKGLAAHDPRAAREVAKKSPEGIRWEPMMWAASAESDPATRVDLYRQALTSGNQWQAAERDSEGIYFAGRTHDTALAREIRDKLAESVLTDINIFNGNAIENAARLTITLHGDMPDLCRLLLELSMKQLLVFNPDQDNEMWTLKPAIQAMALIDPDRAIEIAESVHGENGVPKSKVEIVRALLTPPARQRDLVGDPTY